MTPSARSTTTRAVSIRTITITDFTTCCARVEAGPFVCTRMTTCVCTTRDSLISRFPSRLWKCFRVLCGFLHAGRTPAGISVHAVPQRRNMPAARRLTNLRPAGRARAQFVRGLAQEQERGRVGVPAGGRQLHAQLRRLLHRHVHPRHRCDAPLPSRWRELHPTAPRCSRGRSPPSPGFQTVVFPGSPGYALYPSVQMPLVRMDTSTYPAEPPGKMTVWKLGSWGAMAARIAWRQTGKPREPSASLLQLQGITHSLPFTITRDRPPSLLISQGIALHPF